MTVALIKKIEYDPFPQVDPGVHPCGSYILVQIRSPRVVSAGGILLTSDTTDTIMWNDQVAKVLELGPLAFKNRDSLSPWPEGQWCEIGDLIIVPKYGGHRYSIQYGRSEEEKANFIVFKDTDVIGKVDVNFDPSKLKAYV